MATFKAFTLSCAPILNRQSVLLSSSLLPKASYAAASSSRSLFQNAVKRSLSSHAGRPKPPLSTPFQPRWKRNASLLTDNQVIQRPADSGAKWTRIASTVAVIVGGAGAISMFNNRETRDSLTAYESNFLNQTFTYLGAGLGIVAASSYGLHRTNFSYRIMRANPWLVIGVSLVASVGSMMAVFSTPPENTGQKMFWWTAFNIAQSATLAPLFFFSPALLARAGLYTAGLVGSLCYVGATARSDKYLYIGGPLFAGLCVVALSSLAPLILPVGTAALAATQGISLYGGLAVFGGFVLYDTQKVLEHSRLAEQGVIPADPVAESIRLILDFLNLFVRVATILAGQQRRK